jgi:hypothetical protein
MQLQEVVITWTHKTHTLLVIKSIGLDINHIVVTKIWSKWRTFLVVILDKTWWAKSIGDIFLDAFVNNN